VVCVSVLCERIIWEIALLLNSSCSCIDPLDKKVMKFYSIIGVLMWKWTNTRACTPQPNNLLSLPADGA
jgi:hypothetical protein